MIVCGIDPGANGAIAIIDSKHNVFMVADMPKDDKTFVDIIRNNIYKPDKTYLEDVHALPRQSTVASFTFGKNVGKAELLAECLGNVELVSPTVWKKALGLKRIEGENKTAYKHRSIALAKELFPECAKMLTASKDGRAEALLIAYYGLLNERKK